MCFAFGSAPWKLEPSAPRGKSVGIIGFDILVIFCAFCMNVICFLHVPVTGRIFPATARKPVGPLPMHSASAGYQDLARRGHLQRRGTTFPGGTSAF